MFTVETLRKMLRLALGAIESHLDELNALDAATGDGDHGTAILAAMRAAVKAAETQGSLADVLNGIGWGIMGAASGSTSSLTGSFYLGMAQSVTKEELDADEVIAMFEGGLQNVRTTTKATVGDKTLMDALTPACESMRASAVENLSLKQALQNMCDAAEKGKESTKGLAAKHGRSARLGERSKGVLDVGAVSCCMLLCAMADGMQKAMAQPDQ